MRWQTLKRSNQQTAAITQQQSQQKSASSPLRTIPRSIGNQATQRLISSPYIQTKLHVSTPDDPSEQEADRTAESVMRMPDAHFAPTLQEDAVLRSTRSRLATETDVADEGGKVVAAKSKARIPVAVREDDDKEERLAQRVCGECSEEMADQSTVADLKRTVKRSAEAETKGPHAQVNDSTARGIRALCCRWIAQRPFIRLT